MINLVCARSVSDFVFVALQCRAEALSHGISMVDTLVRISQTSSSPALMPSKLLPQTMNRSGKLLVPGAVALDQPLPQDIKEQRSPS